MFCPNCGTENESSAKPCKKCGFKLSGVSAPKFKGTMMLNADQSVQDLIDAHKKKAAEEPATSAAEQAPSGPSIPKPGPPRANKVPRRQMAGTMLGVAPQVGGVAPPSGHGLPPVAEARPPAPDAPAGALTPRGTHAALAGTAEMPAQVNAGTAQPAVSQPLPEVAPSLASDGEAPSEPAPPELGTPQSAEAAVPLSDPDLMSPVRRGKPRGKVPPAAGVSALEIGLIVATCGIYGVVLLLRQRRS